MVINLDLRSAGTRQYILRLNLTGGVAVTISFRDDDDRSLPTPPLSKSFAFTASRCQESYWHLRRRPP